MGATGGDRIDHIRHLVADFPWPLGLLRDIPDGFITTVIHVIHFEDSRSCIHRILDFRIFGLFKLGLAVIFHLQIFAAIPFDG
jgi:hypothetical protein